MDARSLSLARRVGCPAVRRSHARATARRPSWRYGLGGAALCSIPLLFALTFARQLEGPRLEVIASGPLPTAEVAVGEQVGLQPAEGTRVSGWVAQFAAAIDRLEKPLVFGWLLGVVLFGLRLGAGLAGLRRLRREGVEKVPSWLEERFSALVERLRLGDRIEIWESARCTVPMTLGFLRPVILLPASTITGLPPHQLESILLHELAHIRRWDYAAHMLQSVIEVLFFYHPVVWWLSHRLRVEREYCCDDLAVRLGGDARGYARSLAALEGLRGQSSPVLAAVGGSLLRRIERLVRPSRRPVGLMAPCLVVALLVAMVAGAQLVASPPQREPQGASAHTEPVVLALRLVGLDRTQLNDLGIAPGSGRELNMRPVESLFYDTDELAQEILRLADNGRAQVFAAPRVAGLSGEPMRVVTGLEEEGTQFEVAIVPTLEDQTTVRLSLDLGVRRPIRRDASKEVQWRTVGATGRVRVRLGIDTVIGRFGRFADPGADEQELILLVNATRMDPSAFVPAAGPRREPKPEYHGEPIDLSLLDALDEDVDPPVLEINVRMGGDIAILQGKTEPGAKVQMNEPGSRRYDTLESTQRGV